MVGQESCVYNQCGWLSTFWPTFLSIATAISFFVIVAYNAIAAALGDKWSTKGPAAPAYGFLATVFSVVTPSVGAWYAGSLYNEVIVVILRAFLCRDVDSIRQKAECANVLPVLKISLNGFWLIFYASFLALIMGTVVYFEVRFP